MHCKEDRYVVKKLYQDVILKIIAVDDDMISCSQWGFSGDDGGDDIFDNWQED